MLKPVHARMIRRALAEKVSPRALSTIIDANVRMDDIPNQLGHDEYHFDNNAFERSRAYIEAQRSLIKPALEREAAAEAWKAFGRLTHPAQDFYSHSNYVDLWLACQPNGMVPAPSEIDPLDDTLIENPALRSCKTYYPWGVLSFVPGIRKFVIPRMPRDAHAHMNLDSEASGPMFEYAFEAAVKRTRHEFDVIVAGLPANLRRVFTGIG